MRHSRGLGSLMLLPLSDVKLAGFTKIVLFVPGWPHTHFICIHAFNWLMPSSFSHHMSSAIYYINENIINYRQQAYCSPLRLTAYWIQPKHVLDSVHLFMRMINESFLIQPHVLKIFIVRSFYLLQLSTVSSFVYFARPLHICQMLCYIFPRPKSHFNMTINRS